MLGRHVLAVQLPGHDRVGVQRLVARQGLGEPVVAVLGHRGALVGPGHHDALVRRVAEAGGRQDVGEARARPARLTEHAEPELVARGSVATQPAPVAGALEHRHHVPGGQLAQLGLAQHGRGTVRPDEPHLAEPTRVGLRRSGARRTGRRPASRRASAWTAGPRPSAGGRTAPRAGRAGRCSCGAPDASGVGVADDPRVETRHGERPREVGERGIGVVAQRGSRGAPRVRRRGAPTWPGSARARPRGGRRGPTRSAGRPSGPRSR